MVFRILGLLEVVGDDGPKRIVRGRESALLALLLLHANEPLATDRVVEELWGETAPENATKSVHIYISRLRKALGADRIETTPAGYLIRVNPGEVDVESFESLAARGQGELEAGRPDRAQTLLDEALAHWRGDALADFVYEPFAQAAARRLHERRDVATADRIDARLALAQAQQTIPELEALIERSPLWERPRAQLMLALYRCGRQTDALDLARATRALFLEELGLEPGSTLQELERRILNHDPSLGGPAPPDRPQAQTLPSGTVTFLFTDVERSTDLLARLGAASYAEILAAHRAALEGAFDAHGGVIVDTQGDSFFVAFARAAEAVACAREAQSALESGPIRVRMGLHTGEPLLTGAGYAGMDVHRAARIAAAGSGGQVLLSQATRDLIVDGDVVDLGEHRLKDLTRPERIYQLGPTAFPALKSLNRSSLPEAAHPIVGRREEQHELAELVRRSRLVTITGTGGIGKTRLALQLAGELNDDFEDGVFFVSLASVSDPDLVLPLALEALGIGEGDTVAGRNALLVLDNFEHVFDAAPALADFLRRSHGPTVLVTSRTPLHVSMELEYALDPLAAEAAVELFLDRARSVRRHTEPSTTIDEICRRLDHLPLALELAAARLKLLDPESLLVRLDSRLPLLTHGPRDLPERQRTLEATIAWSYDLLDDGLRPAFAQLSVFAGTFSVEAAEAVVGADLDVLATLVDASLLKPRGNGRFLMLETIREFARNRLSDPEAMPLPGRHAGFFLELAERAQPHLTGPEAADWLNRLDADQGNFRAALDWYALEEPRLSIRLAIALWRWWLLRGRYEEGQVSIERALRSTPSDSERGELLYQLGALAISRGATERGRELSQQALETFRSIGHEEWEAKSLSMLGHVATDAGRWPEAIGHYEDAAVRFRRLEHRLGLAGVLSDLASTHLRSGSPAEARPLALESRDLQREIGNRPGEALALAVVGYTQLDSDLAEARRSLAESTKLAQKLGYLHALVFSLNGLAVVAFREGDVKRAAAVFEAALALRAEIGIEHDPEDALVAETRAQALEAAGERDDEFDLDRAVALALAE